VMSGCSAVPSSYAGVDDRGIISGSSGVSLAVANQAAPVLLLPSSSFLLLLSSGSACG
jgi:hypothetical protein